MLVVLRSTLAAALATVAFSSLAAPVTLFATLSGAAEAPPNASPGTGVAVVEYDPVAHTMSVDLSFDGLLGTVTASHIHCCTAVAEAGTAGVATPLPTFPGFPSGVTSGIYAETFDLTLASSWNPAFIAAHGGTPAGAEADFAAGLLSGRAYWNIHTTLFTPGEIRGFLVVPEPATALLAALAVGFVASRRRPVRQPDHARPAPDHA